MIELLTAPGAAGAPAVAAGVLLLAAGAFPVLLWARARRAPEPLRPAIALVAGLLAAAWVGLAVQPGPRTQAEAARAAGGAALAFAVGLVALRYLPRALAAAGEAGRVEDLERLWLLEAAVAASEDGVLVAGPAEPGGPALRIEYANPAFERLTGYVAAEAVGQSPSIFQGSETDDDDWTALPAVRDAFRASGPVRVEVPGRWAGRGRGWTEWHVVPVPAGDGGPGFRVAVIRDTTGRRAAEEAARTANAELGRRVEQVEALIELSPVGIAVASDPAGRAVEVNRVLRDMLGLPPAPDLEMTPAPDRLRVRARRDGRDVPPDDLPMYQCLRAGTPVDGVELRIAVPGGGERVVVNSARPLFDVAGRVRGCVSVYTDITPRIRAEAALREGEALLRNVISHIPCGVFWKDRDSVFLGCNDQFARDHDLPDPAAVVGLTDRDLPFTAAEAGEHVACDRRVIETGRPLLNLEENRSRTDGVRCDVLVSKVPLLDAGGEVAGVLGVYQDITARKGLEEQFRQAQKMDAVGRLAGGVAHDFNNLLTVINGNADLLRHLPPGDPDAAGLLDDIAGAGERAAGLVRQLLTFSRRQPVRPESLDLNDVVARLAGFLRRLLGERVAVLTTPAPGPAPVRIDRGQLEQVLVNLAVNARDAMPGGGTVAIAVEAARTGVNRGVRLEVADTGTGMTDEVRARLFEPFFTTKGPDKGTGLGLAVVHGIVEQAGGRIAVESAAGVGTTFRIDLPWCDDPAARTPVGPARDAAPGPSAGRPTVVLLVEDEPGVRKFARLALEGQGYAVTEAGDGEAALTWLEWGGTPDLLVTDLRMPGIDGRELAGRVRIAHPEVGIVLVSGQPPEDVLAGFPLGVFVPKPYQPGELLRAARKALSGRPAEVARVPALVG